jgi:hypothetical protein
MLTDPLRDSQTTAELRQKLRLRAHRTADTAAKMLRRRWPNIETLEPGPKQDEGRRINLPLEPREIAARTSGEASSLLRSDHERLRAAFDALGRVRQRITVAPRSRNQRLGADSAEPRCRGPVSAIPLAFSTLSVGRSRVLKLITRSLSDHRTAARHRSDERCNDHQSRCAHVVLQMSTAYLQIDAGV